MDKIGIRTIVVNFDDEQLPYMSLVQGDAKTRGFDIVICDSDGKEIPPSDDYIVELVATGSNAPDKPYANRHTVIDGKYRVMIPTEALSKSGFVVLQLVFYQKSTGAVIHTIEQKCPVYRSRGQEVVESNNLYVDITALRLGIEKIEVMETAYLQVLEDEETRKSNEIKRETNEATRKSNEVKRESNETTRKSQETARKSAEDKRVIAEEERGIKFDSWDKTMEGVLPNATDTIAGVVKVDKMPTETGEITVPSVGKLEEVTTQLAHTKNKTKSYTTYSEPIKKPMVSFVDDDGNRAVLTKLKPLFFEKQVPYNLAIITGVLGTGAYMAKGDLKDLYTNGWEFLGHGHTVTGNLTNYPIDDDLDYQLGECKRFLNNEGYAVSGFVYPQSAHNKRIRMFTKIHYDFAFAGTGIGDLLDTMTLPRIALGSWTDGNPTINGNSEKNTLAYYKECVDYAFDNNTWLTFMTHCGDVNHDETQMQHMSDLIDYIKSKNIDIVTVSEGYSVHGNKLFSGDLEDTYTIINDGVIHTNTLDNRRLLRDKRTPSTPILDYENLTITTMECSNNFAVTHSLPENSPGVLTTYKYTNTLESVGFNKQYYALNVNDNIYARKPINLTEWGDWKLITYDADIVNATALWRYVGANFKPVSALSTEYPNKRISVSYVYGSGSTGFPNNSSGLLITYRFSSFQYQVFKELYSYSEYSRYAKEDGTWSDWGGKIKYNVPEIVIPANSSVEHNITHNGIVPATTSISGNPSWGLNSNVMYNVFATATNTITIRLFNLGSTSVTVGAREWWFSVS